jgi:hypothetical protein
MRNSKGAAAMCSTRNERSRPHMTRIDLLTCVNDVNDLSASRW